MKPVLPLKICYRDLPAPAIKYTLHCTEESWSLVTDTMTRFQETLLARFLAEQVFGPKGEVAETERQLMQHASSMTQLYVLQVSLKNDFNARRCSICNYAYFEKLS
jgi:hypothetical protein